MYCMMCVREREATGDGQESGVKRRGGGTGGCGGKDMTDRETDALTYRRRKFKWQGRLSLMWYLICKWTWCHNRRIWMAWAWGCEEHRLAPPVAGVVRPPSSRPWAYPNASWPCAKPGFLHKHAKLVPQTLPSIRIRYASKTLLPSSSLSRHCRLPLVNISFFRLVELSDTWLEVIHHLVFSDATAKKNQENGLYVFDCQDGLLLYATLNKLKKSLFTVSRVKYKNVKYFILFCFQVVCPLQVLSWFIASQCSLRVTCCLSCTEETILFSSH